VERILGKVDNVLSCLRDECYMAAVTNVHSLVQKDLGTTTMMTKIDHELSRQRNKVNHLTLGIHKIIDIFCLINLFVFLVNEKYSQLVARLIQ
jgi:hypothetical protein